MYVPLQDRVQVLVVRTEQLDRRIGRRNGLTERGPGGGDRVGEQVVVESDHDVAHQGELDLALMHAPLRASELLVSGPCTYDMLVCKL